MNLPDKDFFKEIETERPIEDKFISEMEEETRIVDEPDDPDEPDEPDEPDDFNDVEESGQPVERFCTYEEEAELYVNILSDTQKIILPKMLEARIITDEDKEVHEFLENTPIPVEISKAQQKVEDKFEFLEEYRSSVQLTDDEKNTIKKPLAACLKMWQSSPSPTYALLFAVVTVEFSRAMPFFTKDFQK